MAFRIGCEKYKYLEGDSKNDPPELMFRHRCHRQMITDISWNKNEPWAETLQVWTIVVDMTKLSKSGQCTRRGPSCDHI
ncbi:hypothetical protein TorRG33x02_142670 [Trema orientale]|uniref:Uncharacterized protein n=1 Tax=Trema orientale TaxID=63057 RepID=A0A2P5EWR9_TREOI|nr:hypothetical protein TorRG33x02_142670 [Trema orientale]